MTWERWAALMASMGLPGSADWFEKLSKAYSERHRFYHTASHIEAMLGHLDMVAALSSYPHELELAIWFHDAIYKPFSSTNEMDSARWVKELLLESHYPQEGVDRVHQLVMATAHGGKVSDADEALIVDIDLSILGAPSEVYDDYERNIRKEYRLVPWAICRKKRKTLLDAFLQKEAIFHLDDFRAKYEMVARENLRRAIEGL